MHTDRGLGRVLNLYMNQHHHAPLGYIIRNREISVEMFLVGSIYEKSIWFFTYRGIYIDYFCEKKYVYKLHGLNMVAIPIIDLYHIFVSVVSIEYP